MRNSDKFVFYIFVAICFAVFLLMPFSTKTSMGEFEYPVNCYIIIEPTDGMEHEFYYAGDSIYFVAHIDFEGQSATPTDLGNLSISDFDIRWLISPDGESWNTIGVGERLELVLNAETAGSYYKFVATQK